MWFQSNDGLSCVGMFNKMSKRYLICVQRSNSTNGYSVWEYVQSEQMNRVNKQSGQISFQVSRLKFIFTVSQGNRCEIRTNGIP